MLNWMFSRYYKYCASHIYELVVHHVFIYWSKLMRMREEIHYYSIYIVLQRDFRASIDFFSSYYYYCAVLLILLLKLITSWWLDLAKSVQTTNIHFFLSMAVKFFMLIYLSLFMNILENNILIFRTNLNFFLKC